MSLLKMLFPKVPKMKNLEKAEKASIKRLIARFSDNHYLFRGRYITKEDAQKLKQEALKHKY